MCLISKKLLFIPSLHHVYVQHLGAPLGEKDRVTAAYLNYNGFKYIAHAKTANSQSITE